MQLGTILQVSVFFQAENKAKKFQIARTLKNDQGRLAAF